MLRSFLPESFSKRMYTGKSSYTPLQQEKSSSMEKDPENFSETSGDPLLQDYPELKQTGKPSRTWKHATYMAIICLIVSNSVLLFKMRSIYNTTDQTSDKCVTKFAGLSYNTPTVYRNYTNFQNMDDEDTLQQTWNGLDITPLEIMLSDAEASSMGVHPSVLRFPWDDGQGIYFLKGFHDLHCLKVIQKAFFDYDKTGSTHVKRQHVYHCLDSVRQALECAADDTPMSVFDLPNKIGDSQVRMCRNMDALVRWTQRADRHPCYRRPSDVANVKNGIEEYSDCHEDSPYYDLVQAYFEKYGHKDQPDYVDEGGNY